MLHCTCNMGQHIAFLAVTRGYASCKQLIKLLLHVRCRSEGLVTVIAGLLWMTVLIRRKPVWKTTKSQQRKALGMVHIDMASYSLCSNLCLCELLSSCCLTQAPRQEQDSTNHSANTARSSDISICKRTYAVHLHFRPRLHNKQDTLATMLS